MESSQRAGSSGDAARHVAPYGSACDTCRRRRVRCDGKRPCTRCVKSDVRCTYGDATARAPAISYTRQLEQRIAELESRLQPPILHDSGARFRRISNDSVQEADHDTGEQSGEGSPEPDFTHGQTIDLLVASGDDYVSSDPASSSSLFYGRFAGLGILRLVGDRFGGRGLTPQATHPGRQLVNALESPSLAQTIGGQGRAHTILPPKQKVLDARDQAVRTGLICHDCIDHDSFELHLARLCDLEPYDYSVQDNQLLALAFAILALGRRCSPSTYEDEIDSSADTIKVKGLGYLRTSLDILNLTNPYNLDAIRAMIVQAQYLVSAFMLSDAYSRLGAAAAAASRMGLHVHSVAVQGAFGQHELYQRRRVFATLNMMDTYMSSMLVGQSKILQSGDTKQALGLHDNDLADSGQQFVQDNPRSSAAESVLCQKLHMTTAKLLQERYPHTKQPERAYELPLESVAQRQTELEDWHRSLSARLDDPPDERALCAQLTLRLWHSFVQTILFRPFLHHIARSRDDSEFDLRGYEYASACVRSAMQIVSISDTFRTYGLLHESNAIALYALVYATTILAFFVASASLRTTIGEVVAAALKARDLLEMIGRHNLAGRRCFELLSNLLDTLLADLIIDEPNA